MKYYKIWLPVLSVLVFFGLAELLCRSFDLTDKLDADFKFYVHNVDDDYILSYNQEDAYLMWLPRPNYRSGGITINSLGFRAKEYPLNKDKNVFRILCLGDSSTFAANVQPWEAYHYLLEEKLNQEFGRGGGRFEVINAGVTGYTSRQGLVLYQRIGVKYKPDIVTFYFGINERYKRFCLSDKQVMNHDVPASVKAAMENSFLLKLHFYRLLRKYVVNVLRLGNNDQIGVNVPRVSPDDFRENILELDQLCKKNGCRLVLISFPYSKRKDSGGHLIRKDLDTFTYRKVLEDTSREYKIPLVRIPEMTEESPLDTDSFFVDDVHPSRLGHKRIMERLYDALIDNQLLPIRP